MFAHIVQVHAAAADVAYVCQIKVRKASPAGGVVHRNSAGGLSPPQMHLQYRSCDHVRFDAVRCEWCICLQSASGTVTVPLTVILRRSRTGTVWFYTSTSNKRAARPKLYTKSLTRDLNLMYSRLTLVRISINL